MNLLLKIEQVIGLVQLGLASGKAIVDAVKAGRAVVTEPSGEVLTAEDVLAHVRQAQDAALSVGDAAAGRIEDRATDEGGD